MPRLKPFLMILPFLFAGLGAFVLAGMLAAQSEPTLPFAYVTWADGTLYDLRVLDVSSGELLFDVNSLQYDCPTSLSPDGRWLIYGQSNNSPENQQYRLVDLQNGEVTDLPAHHHSIRIIDWTNGYFRYWVAGDTNHTYQHYDLATHTIEQIAQVPSRPYPSLLQWYDGEVVSIARDYDARQLIISRGTNEPSVLQLPENSLVGTTLSHDARYLFYRITSDSNTSIGYVIDTVTLEILQEFENIQGLWQPSSNDLYYFNDDDNLILYNVVSGEVRTFVIADTHFRETFVSNAQWSPDNRYMAYTIHHPGGTRSTSLNRFVFDITTGESMQIGQYILPDAYRLVWVSATQLVYPNANADYIEVNGLRQPPPKDLWVYDVTTGETIQLTNTLDISEDVVCTWG